MPAMDITYEVKWSFPDTGVRTARLLSSGVAVGESVDDLGLRGMGEPPISSLAIMPRKRCQIHSVRAIVSLDLTSYDALYLNGYNSWTDSVERPIKARMRNFGVPRAVIDRWVLDGSGDYRFVESDERRGHQHGFGYGYLRKGVKVLFFGSLDEDRGFTVIREDAEKGELVFEKEPQLEALPAAATSPLMRLFFREDGLEECVEEWLSLSCKELRPSQPMVGYTSWYRHYTDINEERLLHDLAGATSQYEGLELGRCAKVFQMDDGYTKVGDWLTPDAQKFPQGVALIARAAREAGFVPGIWLAPFVCERESALFHSHQDWLLRDDAGNLVSTGSHWSGQVALDTQNPEVRAYVTKVLRTMTGDWGFGLLKCDFLYGACMLPHAGLNRGELMADALDLIRSSVTEGTWLDFCGVPLVSAMGRSEFCRIGCDVGLDWDDKPFMRLTGRERVSTKNSLANTRGRAHLDGRAFRCDPDVVFLRDDVKLTDAQRRDMIMTDAQSGGVLFTSDDMSLWNNEQKALFNEALDVFVQRSLKEVTHAR